MFQSMRTSLGNVSTSSWVSTLAAIPLMIWAQDSLASLYVVRGSSMEPSLKSGDIVVLRKADGFWQRWTRHRDIENDSGEDPERIVQRRRQIELEISQCHSNGPSRILQRPPLPVVGDIVVYQDPTEYPVKYSIKRVVGLGAQIVMMPSNRYPSISRHRMNDGSKPSKEGNSGHSDSGSSEYTMRVACTSVPPYSLFVEGDNFANSKDSRNDNIGPVSKKQLIGIAEYRIWPPTRIGRLDGESADCRSDPKPYSYWPF